MLLYNFHRIKNDFRKTFFLKGLLKEPERGAYLLPVHFFRLLPDGAEKRKRGQPIRTGAGAARIPRRTQAENGGRVPRTKRGFQRGYIASTAAGPERSIRTWTESRQGKK